VAVTRNADPAHPGVLRRATDRVLESPFVYRWWQAPFADAKLRPFRARVDVRSLGRVLDVGCGPGTNAPLFAAADYVGVDVNPGYIAHAARQYPGRFLVGDVRDPSVLPDERFDCVFANSLLHHLSDDVVRALLRRLATLTAPGGAVHILDLVRPQTPSVSRLLAGLDRGRFARSFDEWMRLFAESLQEHHAEQYSVGIPGIPLWRMVYLSGAPR
jgi:trans-aconitate methyltransferase